MNDKRPTPIENLRQASEELTLEEAETVQGGVGGTGPLPYPVVVAPPPKPNPIGSGVGTTASTCNGDEAGTLKGTISQTTGGPR